MAANIDIKKSSRIKLDKDGYRATRIAIVSGVAGTAESVLYNAINDSQLPDIGDVHPDVSSITLQDIVCEPMSGGQYRVTMMYYKDSGQTGTSASAEVRANTGLAVEETSLDINGDSMVANYGTLGGALIRQRFTAEVERPRIVFDFEYTASAYPTTDINTYLGKVNSIAWNGYAPGTIMCSAINVDQAGAEYRVRYSFAYRVDGWQFRAKLAYAIPVFLVAEAPDYGIDLETGTKNFTVYNTVDFTPLGFTFDTVGYTALYEKGRAVITGADVTLTVA